jgi:hypothetical protein
MIIPLLILNIAGRSATTPAEVDEHGDARRSRDVEEYGYPISEEDREQLDIQDRPEEQDEDDVMDQIINEVDRGLPLSQNLADETVPPVSRFRPRRRGVPFSYTYSSTFLSERTISWWTRFKKFVFPPTPDLDSLIPHYRLTPIISGIVIPFSILLEIPGLTEHWYIRTDSNKIVEIKSNSGILDAGLAISMASAVAANLFFVFRLLEWRVKTMTIICIMFLTLHGEHFLIFSAFGSASQAH